MNTAPPRLPGPGSQVHLFDPKSGARLTTAVNSQGGFDFGEIPDDFKQVVVEVVVTGPDVGPNRAMTSAPRFLQDYLVPPADTDQPNIAAIVNAATNLPDYMPQGNVVGNGIYLAYGTNLGPDNLVSAPGLPLQEDLQGFRVKVISNGQEYAAHPLFASKNQVGFICPSRVDKGPANVIVSYQGKESLPYGVFNAAAQPGVFTLDQTGQRFGIFTRVPDYRLVTIHTSVQPDQYYTAWMTGLGDAPNDAQGGVFDKRSSFFDYRAFLGGVEIPKEDIAYGGNDSSIAGLDLFTFKAPKNVPLGCSVPFWVSIESLYGTHVSTPVLMPVSTDGGPCGDAHSLSAAEVSSLANPASGPFTLGTVRLLDSSVIDGETRTDRLFASYDVFNVTGNTYVPTIVPNTCTTSWTVPNAVNPSAPERAALSGGSVRVQIPGAFFDLNANNNGGPFTAVFAPSNSITDGAATVNIQNLNVRFPRGGLEGVANQQSSATYDHNATRAKNSLIDGLMPGYRQSGAVSIDQFFEQAALLGGLGGPLGSNKSVFFSFNQTVNTPRGSYGVSSTCHINLITRSGTNEFHGSLFDLFPQPRGLSANQFFNNAGTMNARIFSPNRNRTVRPGIINRTEEAYEALLSFGTPLYRFLRNTPPTMTIPGDQTVPVGGDSGALPVVVADDVTDAASLVLTAGSSNQAVVRNSDITLGGSGANRTIRIRPSGERAGQASIGVSLRDGTYSKTLTFTLSTTRP